MHLVRLGFTPFEALQDVLLVMSNGNVALKRIPFTLKEQE
jgi:hypothetical protein